MLWRLQKKCPNCGQFILVRTRPQDKRRVLVTEAQAREVEDQWDLVRGVEPRNAANAKRYEKERTRLAGKFGREPSAGDMKWAILNHDLLLHARNMDWGLYRNARLQMADILAREHRTSDALAAYLEVCYLDLNGPSNCGGISGDLLEEYPPWQVLDGFLAPGVVVRKNSIRHESKIDTNNKELE